MMENKLVSTELELLCFVVNFGLGSKVVKLVKKHGISGGTILLGRGTIKNKVLEFLDINDTRKEIVLIISEKERALEAIEEISKELHLEKPNHGIGFTISVSEAAGCRGSVINEEVKDGGAKNIMHNAIFVVVEKGSAEDVIDAATKAGSKGGTIINARGSGLHETHTLFSMAIEPEKEVVMILTESDLKDSIVESIKTAIKIDEPGKGILFVLDTNKTYGLY